jgi:Na+/H+ antiporter NhaD/arsenite permease-like protein
MSLNHASDVPLAASLPFLLMLAAIAICPMFVEKFWDKNRNKLIVALILSAPVLIYFMIIGMGAAIYDSVVFDYIPFIVMLGALFVITGGIHIEGRIGGIPWANTVLLLIGTVLASFLGTTGAAMLLIRPLLHSNLGRKFKAHTVLFFIATVCNCGGLLTPLGDPPLFMMYLRGAPFEWFFRLWPIWACVNGILLLIYFAVDSYFWRKESEELRKNSSASFLSVNIKGKLNFVWLLGVVLILAVVSPRNIPSIESNRYIAFTREAVILLMAGLSIALTRREIRAANHFTWHPIAEVASLFLGIFITIVPCIVFLERNAHQLGISSPVAFYFTSGALSSVLDNTPTAVTLYSLVVGLAQHSPDMVAGISASLMAAICCGSVFFGAMTYIGNGPNFMVRTIAEHRGVHMPHFFQYVWVFSLPVLLPVFALIQLLFVN